MRVAELRGAFGLDNLVLAERPSPVPGPGQVVVQVVAASLNYRDWLMVEGHYNPRQPLPLVPVSDGVGRVLAVGPGVQRVRVGDRVAGAFFPHWVSGEPTRERMRLALGGPLDGALCEEWLLPEEGVVHVPEHLTDEEAACLPCAAVTAWNALAVRGRVLPGDTVLVQGTGGVSLFALQFARMVGARVVLTSSSDEKLARAKAMGAWGGLNYRELPEWGKEARRLTGGEGVDHVVEVGGAGTLAQSLRAVRPGGQVSLIGVLAGGSGEVSLIPVLMQNVRVQGITVGDRESFEAMNRAVTQHGLRPVVDRVFPLEEVHAAFRHLASGAHFGKVVVRVR
ncbi:MAG: NAD(P)-dependent alcohol dehydrogenase [Myxococcaceae bacterium]|nr:NAD(P)-dependent alcohol dehydrogenase [Myxococcaceae bacterium]MCI0673029.1 NAD(P)-dependent alcohol dehydrogenase [Myxococcaceae bacterium]